MPKKSKTGSYKGSTKYGNLIYGVPQDEKTIDDIIKEKASEKTSELQGIEAAKILAAKKERWTDVLKYDTANMSEVQFFNEFRMRAPQKVKNLLYTTIAELALLYPNTNQPTTINEVKALINQASLEGKLTGDILGNAVTLTKALDNAQASTTIGIESPILNVSGDIDRDRYDISKDLKIKDFDLALKTTFDEGKQTKSKYKLETPKFKYKDLETQLALEREEDKYNTSNLLKLAADYDMGNLKLGVRGELEKDKHGVTSKVIPKATYDVPTDYGTLSASASKNIIEGGKENALLSYAIGDKGNPAEQDDFFRLSAEVNPIEGEKKAFIAIKRILEPEPKYLFSKAAGGIMQVEREGFAKGPMDPSKRNFIKIFGGLMAAIPLAKWMKFGPKAKKLSLEVMKHVKGIGMPRWFHQLVNRVIAEGTDVTKILGRVEREVVHTKSISKTEDVTVYQNLDTGNVRVEYGSPEFDKTGKVIRASNDSDVVHLEYKAPKVVESGKYKGKKTKSEFSAMESEPEVVNWDGDIEKSGEHIVGKVDDLVTDTSKLKEYGTGKKLNIKDRLKAEQKKKYQQKLESDTMEQIDYIENKQGGRAIEDYIEEAAERGDLHRGADVEGIGYNLPEKTKKASGGSVDYDNYLPDIDDID